MSIFDKILESFGGRGEVSRDASRFAVVDAEVGIDDRKVHDVGAVRWDGAVMHSADKKEVMKFLKDVDYVCGHNIIHHDAMYLFEGKETKWTLVDTLYVSPLLFPERPYHRLVKDDKLISDQVNNPVNDCEKARDLLMDEVARWNTFSTEKRQIFASLLSGVKEFEGFLAFAADLAKSRQQNDRNGFSSETHVSASLRNVYPYYTGSTNSEKTDNLAELVRSEPEALFRVCPVPHLRRRAAAGKCRTCRR